MTTRVERAPRRIRRRATTTAAPAPASVAAFRAWWSLGAPGSGTSTAGSPAAVSSATVPAPARHTATDARSNSAGMFGLVADQLVGERVVRPVADAASCARALLPRCAGRSRGAPRRRCDRASGRRGRASHRLMLRRRAHRRTRRRAAAPAASRTKSRNSARTGLPVNDDVRGRRRRAATRRHARRAGRRCDWRGRSRSPARARCAGRARTTRRRCTAATRSRRTRRRHAAGGGAPMPNARTNATIVSTHHADVRERQARAAGRGPAGGRSRSRRPGRPALRGPAGLRRTGPTTASCPRATSSCASDTAGYTWPPVPPPASTAKVAIAHRPTRGSTSLRRRRARS